MEGDTIEINCTMTQQETSLTAGLDIRNLTFNIQPIEPFHSRINVTEILVSVCYEFMKKSIFYVIFCPINVFRVFFSTNFSMFQLTKHHHQIFSLHRL